MRFLLAIIATLALDTLLAKEVIAQVRFWHRERGQNKEFLDKLVREFNATSTVKIEASYVYATDFKALLVRNKIMKLDLPHIALTPGDFVSTWKTLSLSPVPTDDFSQLSDKAVHTVLANKKAYGLPILLGNHLMLFYNRTLVKEPIQEWSELKTLSRKLPKGKQPILYNFGEMYWFAPFLGAFGGWPLNDAGDLTLDSSAMADALTFVKAQLDDGLFQRSCDLPCAQEGFIAGKAAYVIDGPWQYSEYKRQLKGDLGIALLPTIRGKAIVPMFSTHALIFPNHSLNGVLQKTLLAFGRFLISKGVQERFLSEVNAFPVRKDTEEAVKHLADRDLRAAFEQLQRARQMPSDTNMLYAWDGMKVGFEKFFSGELDAKKAAAVMQTTAITTRKANE